MAPISLLVIAVAANFLVVASGIAAYADKFFFVHQMRERGLKAGFPFVIHGAMWSDLLVVSPILVVLCAFYGPQWDLVEWSISGLVGAGASLILHFGIYLRGSLPGSHGSCGRLTTAGFLHLIYTAFALQIFGLFYFLTAKINHPTLLAVSVLLGLHILTGLAGQVWASVRHSDWFPERPHKSLALWMSIFTIWLFIAWRTVVAW